MLFTCCCTALHRSCRLRRIPGSVHCYACCIPRHNVCRLRRRSYIGPGCCHCPYSSVARRHSTVQRIPYPGGYNQPSSAFLFRVCRMLHSAGTVRRNADRLQYIADNRGSFSSFLFLGVQKMIRSGGRYTASKVAQKHAAGVAALRGRCTNIYGSRP